TVMLRPSSSASSTVSRSTRCGTRATRWRDRAGMGRFYAGGRGCPRPPGSRSGLGLGDLQRRFQYQEQAPRLAGHQREARVQLGAQVVALGAFQLVDRAFQELQLAHDQVLAEHEGQVVVEVERQL